MSGPGGTRTHGFLSAIEANQSLQKTPAKAELPHLDEDVYQVLRVEAGLPAAGHELSEAYTPLEAGLQTAVSDSKGCYTGQEVIARQITYDKVTRSLCGLKLDAASSPGAQFQVDDKKVGTLTSFAQSPRFGAIALGIIKSPFNQPGTRLIVQEKKGKPIPAQVASLPFN